MLLEVRLLKNCDMIYNFILMLNLKCIFFRITYMQLPLQSKWLYVGTERGNVHVVQIENFHLSGYVINWNKAIEL